MNSNSKFVDEAVFETAAVELGVPIEVVKKVFMKGQVQFTSRKIAEGSLETIMWPRFGKFRPKFKAVYKSHTAMASREIKKVTKKPK